jgi:hypothetical protein
VAPCSRAIELALPDAGRLVMAEGERQLEVDTSQRPLRERYRSEFAQRRAAMRNLARQRQIPVLPLDTASDVRSQLRELLGLAARRGQFPALIGSWTAGTRSLLSHTHLIRAPLRVRHAPLLASDARAAAIDRRPLRRDDRNGDLGLRSPRG